MRIGSFIGDIGQKVPLLGRLVRNLRLLLSKAQGRGPAVDASCQQRAYNRWIEWHETNSLRIQPTSYSSGAHASNAPIISFLLACPNDSLSLLDSVLYSLQNLLDTNWEICVAITTRRGPQEGFPTGLQNLQAVDARFKFFLAKPGCDRATALNLALSHASGELVAVIDPADSIDPNAAGWLANYIGLHPDCNIIYTDEDCIDSQGTRSQPKFKSKFNYLLLLTGDFFGRLTAYRRLLLKSVGGFRSDLYGAEEYDVSLRCFAASERKQILHIPKILYHRRSTPTSTRAAKTSDQPNTLGMEKAVTDFFHSQRIDATTTTTTPVSPYIRIRYGLPDPPPLVSIVICTRDHESLLRKAIDSICLKSSYRRYEIIIVDNGSSCGRTLQYLEAIKNRPHITVLRRNTPFNYSELNNFAIERATGELLCLLNDDIEVVTPGWLEEMIMFGLQPEVGAVGARLWYPDGTLQHGGVVLGIGRVAGHAHLGLPKGKPGYFGRAIRQQEISAVTGACLLMRRDVFYAVGGLDEAFPADFNDVDLCLRIRKAGYSIIWTPYAELIHHESASRGKPTTTAKRRMVEDGIRLMESRWGKILRTDPYYSENLSDRSCNFTIKQLR